MSKYCHLVEEMKELFEALENGSTKSIAMELADCCLLLYGIASLNNIDITAAIEVKLEINKTRKWGNPDKYGVVKHV